MVCFICEAKADGNIMSGSGNGFADQPEKVSKVISVLICITTCVNLFF